MSHLISGIQQIGIGIPDVEEAWKWYRCRFGMDIPIFREAAEAPLMTPYTGGEVHSRDALLAINLRGGGGLEIWQYTSRKTAFPAKPPVLGDTGIFAARIKSDNVSAAHRALVDSGCRVSGVPLPGPDGEPTFFVHDPWGNLFQIVPSSEWFKKRGHVTGGPSGALIGVKNIEASLKLYRDALGFDTVVYDSEDRFTDWSSLNGGGGRFRRILLSRSEKPPAPSRPSSAHPGWNSFRPSIEAQTESSKDASGATADSSTSASISRAWITSGSASSIWDSPSPSIPVTPSKWAKPPAVSATSKTPTAHSSNSWKPAESRS